MHVCVIGAGIVGLASGYALQQAGYEVSLVERAEAPAMGASGGNGAQLSYAYVQPLADPGIWASLPKLLLDKTSPLHMRWQLDPHQWSWLLQFLGACNAASSRATTQSLLTLAAQSRAALEATLQREQLNCDFHTPGKLVLQSTQVGLDGAARQLQLQAQLGGPQQHMVDAAEVARLEPALQHYVSQIAGAVYTPSECAIDCRKLCEALLALLRQRGAQVLLGCEVQQFQTQGSRITGVQTTRGVHQADHFVLAGGWESVPLARQLGVKRLPVYPLKGYSLTLDAGTAAEQLPRVSVTDSSRKVVFARIGERLRVAGMVEIVGADRALHLDRIERLREATHQVFPQLDIPDDLQPWTGMRPATPTGLPITGRMPGGPQNLWLQTGHGALGLTLAFGSAQRLLEALDAAC
ncbi:D-amino acid dehydrogenase [Comamonas kerstersii]|uniref:FAD-dependent oxidoreductase n=1 Tax=Comamonas kerstersii TaxID=225992 RepID=A0A6A1R2L3_9BURK|nr:D-amino acid dehydrogenase [Comamonas kerstersii]KAB0586680.1 FAD-dependent oxidoreductase [Comamonas kerstersii]